MVLRFILIVVLLANLSCGSAKQCSIDKIKDFKVPESEELCKSHFEEFISSLDTDERWAHDMLSSYANFDKTYFYGNTFDFGDFDRCLSINEMLSGRTNNNASQVLKGKHCMVQYLTRREDVVAIPPSGSMYNRGWKNIDSRFGGAICIPESCSANMIRSLMERIFNETDLEMATDYDQEDYCQVSENKKFENIDNVAVFLFALIISLVVASTTYDYFCEAHDLKASQILISFSAYTNTKEVFDFNRNKRVAYFSGMKGLSCLGIIVVHSVLSRLWFPVRDPREVESFLASPIASTVNGFFLNVDTFLLISGLLISRTIFRELDSKSFNLLKTYLHRYVRLTPALIAQFIIQLIYLHQYPRAPYLISKLSAEPCKKYWWAQLLHIQNYVDVQNQCNPVTWYLSVDFQLLLLTPLMVYAIWKYKWTPFVIFPSIICSLQILTYLEVLRISDFLEGFNLGSYLYGDYAKLYHQTHFRASPWIIGILLGYLMRVKKNLQTNKMFAMLMWIFTAVIFGKAFFSGFLGFTNFIPIVFALDRLLWAIAVGWLVVACHYGFGGVIGKFFSLSFWLPIERIGLSIYLSHIGGMIFLVQSRKRPVEFDLFAILMNLLSDLTASLFTGLAYHLLFEKPFVKIFNHIINKRKSDEREQKVSTKF